LAKAGPANPVRFALPRLGVNIDHVATLRQLRGTPYPSLPAAARLCELAGAEQITIHLREDRRHIQDQDVRDLRKSLRVEMNLEMAATPEMIRIAQRIQPAWVCLVPEKRTEVTTEGGLNLKTGARRIGSAIRGLAQSGIQVSLFIEPSLAAVKASRDLGAHAVELHTGRYCLAKQAGSKAGKKAAASAELKRIQAAARLAVELGMRAHAGHGIDYENIRELVARVPEVIEYNIGHVIVCRAALVGMEQAVREMVAAVTAP
jgi:pyridoxine 5-phosphate synthase